MSVGSVFTIMTEDLKKKKLCALFVPHTLTTEQKEHRIASSEDLIAAADEEPNFLKTIVTGDESWCLKYDPETKRQSSEWTSPGKGRPMKVLASKSKTKTMLLVFFDSRGIIHHEFLRQGSTVTGAFHKDVQHRLLKRMRRGKGSRANLTLALQVCSRKVTLRFANFYLISPQSKMSPESHRGHDLKMKLLLMSAKAVKDIMRKLYRSKFSI
ncbi:HTH_48 domain-containing protein [Nephila pilipes]|uniref:HTH_48 domain-containing protein n=1 Tax=Nephila pilipes TaxID=299642 RepID=A0A8X6U8B3_NEPPI|nr:HTH_48 domain-containing protein [Nephila pilipes]